MLTFHTGPGGNQDPIPPLMDRMVQLGLRPCLKATDDYARLDMALSRGGWGVFRLTTRGQQDGFDYDAPNYRMAPPKAASTHWGATKVKLAQISAARTSVGLPPVDKRNVWIELINEVDKNKSAWLAEFCVEAARLANADGYKVSLPGWSSGEPEMFRGDGGSDYDDMLSYLTYCAENWDTAAVSLHEYNWAAKPADDHDVYPWHWGRFQWMFAVCDDAGIRRPRTHISEFGFAYNWAPPADSGTEIIANIAPLYWEHAEIEMVALWALQAWQNIEGAIASYGPRLGDIQQDLAEGYRTDYGVPLDEEYFDTTPVKPGTRPLPLRLWDFGMALVTIDTNTEAALQRAIAATSVGYFMAGDEAWTTQPEGRFACQPAYSAEDDLFRVYVAEVGRWDEIWYIEGTEVEIPRVVDISGDLPKNPSSPYATNGYYAIRDLAQINRVVIHHSASPASTTPEAIATFHTRARNWPGIAYHYLVASDGTLYLVNDEKYITFHAGGHNSASIGVCLIGDFGDAAPPEKQLEAAAWLVRHIKAAHGVLEVAPHRALSSTACPGDTWEDWFYRVAGTEPPPPEPPPSTAIDLLPFLLAPEAHAHMLQTSWGPQEKVRVAHDPTARVFRHIKNRNYEEMRYDGKYIWRGTDTSPGADNTGRDRFYTLWEDSFPASRWAPRYWRVGELFQRNPTVVFKYKDNCQPAAAPYQDPTALRFVAVHNGSFTVGGRQVTVGARVIELEYRRGSVVEERYWYAMGMGLVGWEAPPHGRRSWYDGGAVPDNQAEEIPCNS